MSDAENRRLLINLASTLIGLIGGILILALVPPDEPAPIEPAPEYLEVSGNVGDDEQAFNLDITTVVIEEGVTSIGDRAFRDCMSLRRIHLPASLTRIGTAAFSGCDALTVIVYGGTVAEWEATSKGDYWCADVPAAEVACTDGRAQIGP